MIPLLHDFEGERVVVVGGGAVALRKARRFAREATVIVFATEFADGFDEVACECRRERVHPDDPPAAIAGAALVVPATDDEDLNDAVAAAADREGCLVNRVDHAGDVVVPASVRSEEVVVAVSTGGASPATAKWLRREVTPTAERADAMVRLQRELRTELKESVPTQSRRRQLLWSVLESDRVRSHLPEDPDAALSAARDVVED